MSEIRINEAGTVQFPMVKHAAEIGWTPIAPEVAKQKRGGEAGMMLRDELEAALSKFNPWMTIHKMNCCDEYHHGHFEKFSDFNEWLNSEDGEKIRAGFGLAKLTDPSNAFFAGDREAYDQAFREYRKERRHEVLCEQFFADTFPAEGDGNHWFELNQRRFDQLLGLLATKDTLPCVGAGLSVPGGFL